MDLLELKAGENSLDVDHHPWEHARFTVVFDILKKNLSVDKFHNIVDFGCGDTFFMEKMRQKLTSASFHGIDIAFTNEILSLFEEKYTEENIYLYSSYQAFLKKHVKPDLILLLDVIEHIEDDFKFMRELKETAAVDQDTSIVITVPAFESLTTIRDKWLGHYRRYTISSLSYLLEKTGYEVQKSGYFFTSLIFPRYLQKLIERISKPNENEITGIGNYQAKPYDNLMKNIMIFDYKLLKKLSGMGIQIPGLSCYSLCKKK
jgi:hypothetical protein